MNRLGSKTPFIASRRLTNGAPYGPRMPVGEGLFTRISKSPYFLPVGIGAAVLGGYWYMTKEEPPTRTNVEAMKAKMEAGRKA